MATTPPIIVLGMHRSGTSMLTRMMQDLGLFMGDRLEPNDEAKLFTNTHDRLLVTAGGSWETPAPFLPLMADERARAAMTRFARGRLESARLASYLGAKRYATYRRTDQFDFPWGWKDPRTMLFLPMWQEIFPDAKYVYIRRHPLDVAASLRKRARWEFDRTLETYAAEKPDRFLYRLPARMFMGLAVRDLEVGVRLAVQYHQAYEQHRAGMADRLIELRYEDVLADPIPAMEQIARFCDLPVEPSTIKAASAEAKPEFAYKFRQDPELAAFAEARADLIAPSGY